MKLSRLLNFLMTLILLITVTSCDRLPAFKTTIRKCCPHDMILGPRYTCVKVPDEYSSSDQKLKFVSDKFWSTFCEEDKCSDLRFKTVRFDGCPVAQVVLISAI